MKNTPLELVHFGLKTYTDDHLNELRKQRVRLKDELYQMLNN